jgi:hypothetical protein
MKGLTRNEAGRIAVTIAKLPELLKDEGTQTRDIRARNARQHPQSRLP